MAKAITEKPQQIKKYFNNQIQNIINVLSLAQLPVKQILWKYADSKLTRNQTDRR